MGANLQPLLIAATLLAALSTCSTQIEGELSAYTQDGVGVYEHRVFITSTTSDGNFGGLSGADARCMSLAQAAGLVRTYKAMLSDETVDVKDRIQITGAVYNFSSATAKNRVSSGALMQSGNLDFGIFFDNNYGAHGLGNAMIATGSLANGTKATGDTCSSWTLGDASPARMAVSGQTGNFLTNTNTTCDTVIGLRLYCISQ